MKISAAADTIAVYRMAAEQCTYPLHIGVTEAGDGYSGLIKNAVGIGSLLADGTMSPMQGCDHCGPVAVMQSAMRVDQDPFQATLLNMKFTPTTLKTDADKEKLASLPSLTTEIEFHLCVYQKL